MKNYVVHQPRDRESALALAREYGDDAVFLAGATELAVRLGTRALEATHLIALRAVPDLHGVQHRPGGKLWIGALTTHQEAAASPLIQDANPTLARMFATIGSVRIRNQATIGGNLATADRAYDPPPMLAVLDASVEVMHDERTMLLPLHEFLAQRAGMPGALVSGVVFSPLGGSARCVYRKLTYPAGPGSGSIQVAGHLTVEAGGRPDRIRLAVGGLSPTPASSDLRMSGRLGLDVGQTASVLHQELIPQLEREPGAFLVDLLRVVVGRTVDDLVSGREGGSRG